MFYNFQCVRKVFFAWQEWQSKKVQDAIKVAKIKSILENGGKRAMFANWRLYIYEKKCRRRKMFLSQNFCKKKLIIKTLRRLYSYAVYRKEKKMKLSYLTDKSAIIIQQLQSMYIEKWRRALYSTVREKRKLSQAIEFWEDNLAHKYFLHWKEFSQQYKVKIIRKERLNKLASGFLLKRYVLHWHAKLQDVLEERKKEVLVASMIDHKIVRKYLLSWKEYVIQKVKMRNDIEAAKEVHKKFLLREGLREILRNSLYSIDSQYSMQLEDAAVRSFKNFEILKEYFNKWHSVIYLKNDPRFLHEVTKHNDPRFTHSQSSRDTVFDDITNTCFVLPEYMKRRIVQKKTSLI